MCGLTFWFRAVVVLWFNFFDLLHLSFLLKSVSAMYNFRSADDQNLIKTNTRKVSVQKFEIWHEDNFTTFCSWTFFNSHWLHVYDRPDIYWSDLNTILTVEKKINFWKYFSWYFFNCHIVSWPAADEVAQYTKWPKQSQLWTN